MKINVEFDSMEDMRMFIDMAYVSPGAEKKEKPVTVSKPVKEEQKIESKKEKATPTADDSAAEDTSEDIPEADGQTAAESDPDSKKYTFTEVRAELAKIAKTHPEKVQVILEHFGVKRLPDVKEEDYNAIMEKAGEI